MTLFLKQKLRTYQEEFYQFKEDSANEKISIDNAIIIAETKLLECLEDNEILKVQLRLAQVFSIKILKLENFLN